MPYAYLERLSVIRSNTRALAHDSLLFQSKQWIQPDVLRTDLQVPANVLHDDHVIKRLSMKLCNTVAKVGVRLDVTFANSCHSLSVAPGSACTKGILTRRR